MLRRERGSVLLLVPAGVLIVLVLASIAVDFAIAFLGERELASLAAAAANDAATAGVDEARLREDGEFVLDEDRVADVVAATLASSSREVDLLDGDDGVEVEVTTVGGDPAVRVILTGRIAYVFAPALPGGPDDIEVSASAVAVAREG